MRRKGRGGEGMQTQGREEEGTGYGRQGVKGPRGDQQRVGQEREKGKGGPTWRNNRLQRHLTHLTSTANQVTERLYTIGVKGIRLCLAAGIRP